MDRLLEISVIVFGDGYVAVYCVHGQEEVVVMAYYIIPDTYTCGFLIERSHEVSSLSDFINSSEDIDLLKGLISFVTTMPCKVIYILRTLIMIYVIPEDCR